MKMVRSLFNPKEETPEYLYIGCLIQMFSYEIFNDAKLNKEQIIINLETGFHILKVLDEQIENLKSQKSEYKTQLDAFLFLVNYSKESLLKLRFEKEY